MNYLFPIKLTVILFFGYQTSFCQPDFVSFIETPCFQIKKQGNQAIRLNFRIHPEYHIQAAELKNKNLIPTKLTFENYPGIEIKTIHYPESVKLPIQDNEAYWETFNGDLKIEVELAVSEELKTGKHELKGNLYYQPCDDVKCFFPRNLEFRVLLFRNSLIENH